MNRGSLRSGVDKVGPLSEDTCKNVARQILLGLDHLHSRFLVYSEPHIICCVGAWLWLT
jgi:serine/threonine protein kinase